MQRGGWRQQRAAASSGGGAASQPRPAAALQGLVGRRTYNVDDGSHRPERHCERISVTSGSTSAGRLGRTTVVERRPCSAPEHWKWQHWPRSARRSERSWVGQKPSLARSNPARCGFRNWEAQEKRRKLMSRWRLLIVWRQRGAPSVLLPGLPPSVRVSEAKREHAASSPCRQTSRAAQNKYRRSCWQTALPSTLLRGTLQWAVLRRRAAWC